MKTRKEREKKKDKDRDRKDIGKDRMQWRSMEEVEGVEFICSC